MAKHSLLGVLVAAALIATPIHASATTTTVAAKPASAGGIGIQLLNAPVSEMNNPRARVYIIDRLAPGTTITRMIGISNTTASVAHVTLYAAAATIANGSFIGDAGHTANELSTWTSVTPGAVEVASKSKLTANVTIAIPRDAPPGEQYAVVWAQVTSAANGKTVTQISRVGIRLYLSIGPGGAPATNFTINSLTAKRSSTGLPSVVATVDNTGGRAVDMSGSLQLLNGPGGLRAGPYPATLGVTLAPGQTEPVTVTLNRQIPNGPWEARMTLISGLTKRTAQATITFPTSGSGPAAITTTASHKSSWPYIVLGTGLIVIAGVGTFLVIRGRRRPRRRRTAAPVRT